MSGVIEKINNYLQSGGLFNPELMEHQKVMDMILEIKDELIGGQQEIDKLKAENLELRELVQHVLVFYNCDLEFREKAKEVLITK